jgi:hypothetical protein
MDRINKFLIIISIGGVITLSVGSSYIPSQSITVPPGENAEEYFKQQQLIIYNSTGFKATIIGLGIVILCVLIIYCRSSISEYREARVNERSNPILKVRQIAPEPIQVTIDDPRPLVKTITENSSPPAQLVPGRIYKGPYFQKISKLNSVRFTGV